MLNVDKILKKLNLRKTIKPESAKSTPLQINDNLRYDQEEKRKKRFSYIKDRESEMNELSYALRVEGIRPELPRDILINERDMISEIRKIVGIPTTSKSDYFETFYLNPILRVAELVQHIPASEYDHHRGVGGLFEHSVEVAQFCLAISRGFYLTPVSTLEIEFERKKRWAYAAFLVGLFHDIGKPMTMLEVYDEKGLRWDSYTKPLYQWTQDNNSLKYILSWREARDYKDHHRVAISWFFKSLDKEVIDYLGSGEDRLIEEIVLCLTEYRESSGYLSSILRKADSISVSKDFEKRIDKLLGVRKMSVESAFIDSVRELRKNVWDREKFNTPSGMIWVIKEQVYLSHPDAITSISYKMREMGIALPQNESEVVRHLTERGMLIAPQEGIGYFMFKPQDYHDFVNLLRVPSPTIVFDGDAILESKKGVFRVVNKGSMDQNSHQSIEDAAKLLETTISNKRKGFEFGEMTDEDFDDYEPTYKIVNEDGEVIVDEILSKANRGHATEVKKRKEDKKSIIEEVMSEVKGVKDINNTSDKNDGDLDDSDDMLDELEALAGDLTGDDDNDSVKQKETSKKPSPSMPSMPSDESVDKKKEVKPTIPTITKKSPVKKSDPFLSLIKSNGQNNLEDDSQLSSIKAGKSEEKNSTKPTVPKPPVKKPSIPEMSTPPKKDEKKDEDIDVATKTDSPEDSAEINPNNPYEKEEKIESKYLQLKEENKVHPAVRSYCDVQPRFKDIAEVDQYIKNKYKGGHFIKVLSNLIAEGKIQQITKNSSILFLNKNISNVPLIGFVHTELGRKMNVSPDSMARIFLSLNMLTFNIDAWSKSRDANKKRTEEKYYKFKHKIKEEGSSKERIMNRFYFEQKTTEAIMIKAGLWILGDDYLAAEEKPAKQDPNNTQNIPNNSKQINIANNSNQNKGKNIPNNSTQNEGDDKKAQSKSSNNKNMQNNVKQEEAKKEAEVVSSEIAIKLNPNAISIVQNKYNKSVHYTTFLLKAMDLVLLNDKRFILDNDGIMFIDNKFLINFCNDHNIEEGKLIYEIKGDILESDTDRVKRGYKMIKLPEEVIERF